MRVCLKAWLAERGHLGNHEDAAILAQVRKFVTANQYSRFADWFDTNHRPANMVGITGWNRMAWELHCVAPRLGRDHQGRDPKTGGATVPGGRLSADRQGREAIAAASQITGHGNQGVGLPADERGCWPMRPAAQRTTSRPARREPRAAECSPFSSLMRA